MLAVKEWHTQNGQNQNSTVQNDPIHSSLMESFIYDFRTSHNLKKWKHKANCKVSFGGNHSFHLALCCTLKIPFKIKYPNLDNISIISLKNINFVHLSHKDTWAAWITSFPGWACCRHRTKDRQSWRRFDTLSKNTRKADLRKEQ